MKNKSPLEEIEEVLTLVEALYEEDPIAQDANKALAHIQTLRESVPEDLSEDKLIENMERIPLGQWDCFRDDPIHDAAKALNDFIGGK